MLEKIIDPRHNYTIGNTFAGHSKLFGVMSEELTSRTEISSAGQALLEMYKKVVFDKQRYVSIWFGNGGSCQQAKDFANTLPSHAATELLIRYSKQFKISSLPAIALDDPTALSAEGNDFGYSFVRQIEAWLWEGNAAIGISTSGQSENVIKALKLAKEHNLITIALTGADGMKDVKVDYELKVPSRETPTIQLGHVSIFHELCRIIAEGIHNSLNGDRK